MFYKFLTFQNENKYCKNNPNYGYSNHFYVNNKCSYCKCNKTYTINIVNYFISKLGEYFNDDE
jgi:hypothetical protein